ncbi:hypothetical protein BJ508DRAFT_417901 [Ascobolus immersus RN42]|uniref:DNA repair protein rad9 n=1 Tax=Ascobolus immersus RN42 TaxID=1160509 RepID=A0A3N4I1Y0_ASCIM|nr:hypothetical protein BJ508DRAFT_417901 [Ascobolus immersus RN42]
MPVLSFSLNPSSIQRLHDALVCLSRFSETVTLEFYKNRLELIALNSSKSSFASITLQGGKFFDRYSFREEPSSSHTSGPIAESRFTCKLLTRSLLSVFRQRGSDAKDKGTAIEKCEVEVKDFSAEASSRHSTQSVECRMNVRMLCKHGVVKTYRLTYEDAERIYVKFDRETAANHWQIESGMLKEYLEHFGPKADQLDISVEGDRAIFTSFTEKLVSGDEILKQPLQTRISLSTAEFESILVENSIHLSIPLRDFKTVIQHADSLRASITAFYNNPGQPLHLAYERDGLACAFTVMTRPDGVGRMAAPIRHLSKTKEPQKRARTTSTAIREREEADTTRYQETPRAAARNEFTPAWRDYSEPAPQRNPYMEQNSFADFSEVQASAVPPRGLLDSDEENEGAEESVTWDIRGDGGGWRAPSRRVTGEKRRRLESEDDSAGEEGVVGPTQRSNIPKGLFD